jgi:hypothetical protein
MASLQQVTVRIAEERADLAATVNRRRKELRATSTQQVVSCPAIIDAEDQLRADDVDILRWRKCDSRLVGRRSALDTTNR